MTIVQSAVEERSMKRDAITIHVEDEPFSAERSKHLLNTLCKRGMTIFEKRPNPEYCRKNKMLRVTIETAINNKSICLTGFMYETAQSINQTHNLGKEIAVEIMKTGDNVYQIKGCKLLDIHGSRPAGTA
jgi:hypothetical protein